jgi:putative transposase
LPTRIICCANNRNEFVAAGVSPAKIETVAADTAASTVNKMIKDRPRRLSLIYIGQPLFFVTFCTRNRKRISSLDRAQAALQEYGRVAIEQFNVGLGRYVIMPDHVHFFVRGDSNFRLSLWVSGLKRSISVALLKEAQATLPLQGRSLWQPGFFDHILRSDESYAEKWNYVRDNPVRAGLVKDAGKWPYQGEVVRINHA